MLTPLQITWGCDPEAFFQRNGKILGSEKVLPEKGIGPNDYTKVVVRDGIQIELNPTYAYNRMALGENIKTAFTVLRKHLANHPEVSLNFEGLVEVDREELDSLSDASRVLGCQPSRNIYGDRPITVDPLTYRKRSAGGHIHVGLNGTNIKPLTNEKLEDDRHRAIPLFDIFVGNTAVMFDRDPGAAERRENYGRAGEYRLQPHGLEYRTLSNFWLRHSALFSLMAGLSSVAIATLASTIKGIDLEGELVEAVNIDKFIKAINHNNYEMARENFDTIRPFLVKHLPKETHFELTASNIDKMLSVADLVQAKGLAAVFPKDPVTAWCDEPFTPFHKFLETI